MRKFSTLICLALLAVFGCTQATTETAEVAVSTITGAGTQFVTLKLPGMT